MPVLQTSVSLKKVEDVLLKSIPYFNFSHLQLGHQAQLSSSLKINVASKNTTAPIDLAVLNLATNQDL